MAEALLTSTSTMLCPHGGPVQAVASEMRPSIGGAPVLVITDVAVVTGCPFLDANGTASPCVSVQWVSGSASVLVYGQPALSSTSTGLCLSAEGVPQGSVTIANVQQRVTG